MPFPLYISVLIRTIHRKSIYYKVFKPMNPTPNRTYTYLRSACAPLEKNRHRRSSTEDRCDSRREVRDVQRNRRTDNRRRHARNWSSRRNNRPVRRNPPQIVKNVYISGGLKEISICKAILKFLCIKNI